MRSEILLLLLTSMKLTRNICNLHFRKAKPTILNTPHYFPPNNFTYSWTLFSKFFSSFPHGTCLLSVSTLYLALGQLYVQLQVAISSNPTLRTHVTGDTNSKSTHGTVTLCGPPFQMVTSWLCTGQMRRYTTTLFNEISNRFSSWAIPGSLAVTKGIVVTFFSSP